MSAAAWPLQQAIYVRLAADLAPVPVYDIAPANSLFPYVTIGEFTGADEYDKSDDAERLTLTLHVWSRQTGRKQCKEILAKMRASLHGKVSADRTSTGIRNGHDRPGRHHRSRGRAVRRADYRYLTWEF